MTKKRQTLADHMKGQGIRFNVDNHAYALRAPEWFEQDDSTYEVNMGTRHKRMTDPRILELAAMPAPDEEKQFLTIMAEHEIEVQKASADPVDREESVRQEKAMKAKIDTRNAADTPLDEYAAKVRARYFARTLLIDFESGESLKWEDQNIQVQNAATDTAMRLWSELNRIPFLSDQRGERQ